MQVIWYYRLKYMHSIYNYILHNVPIFDFLPVHLISMFA